MRPALAGLAAAAVLMTAACSAQEEPTGTATTASPEATESAEATEEPAEEEPADGPSAVPNVTGLILETGQANLMLAGLEVELVDAAGAPVEVADPMTYLVVAQDPADGELERGETVTLTVEPRG
ncbi:PASTA domain-containing protein [Actinotalea sp. Marseille-Q4924]|uniref:PASTA domain-containing protein n=1 Tax=Actinotalea sp. Marseille-Q4924 TaxID=2866571 RepID=UPI001CE3E9FE|nr:PASTA domain-containing protein [Actinotalea sp. Marseille-Q4924]